MTRIKLCGIMNERDASATDRLKPEYAGFVFFRKSRRYVSPEKAKALRALIDPSVCTVGVFVDESPDIIAGLISDGIIGMVQLHGHEDREYISHLRSLTDKPIIQAFRISSSEDVKRAECSSADHILLDSGSGGTGKVFNWELIHSVKRTYFLAGGLDPKNVQKAIETLHPFAVDVSSGIETDGHKDIDKMAAFVRSVRSGSSI